MNKPDTHSYATDEELFAQARTHMEKFSVAASLDRRLWDATVRLVLRHSGPSDGGWRDAARERPHRDRLVIAWSEPYGAVLANRMTSNPDFGWSCEGKVTHWMPMPDDPPSATNGSQK